VPGEERRNSAELGNRRRQEGKMRREKPLDNPEAVHAKTPISQQVPWIQGMLYLRSTPFNGGSLNGLLLRRRKYCLL